MSAKPAGTFCWADLVPGNHEREAAFYRALFGWSIAPGTEESGGYAGVALSDAQPERSVAGIMATQTGEDAPPPSWTVYLAAPDISATQLSIAEHGGSVLVPKSEVKGMGWFGVYEDPTGAVFGLWQGTGFDGFDAFGEPGAFCWAEVYSRDAAKARDFYVAVLGFEAGVVTESEAFTYYQLTVPGEAAPQFGVMQMGDAFPPEVPSHFGAYVWCSDVDATVEQAVSLGATVYAPLTDTPYGRMATLTDTGGAFIKVVDPDRAVGPRPGG